MIVLALVVAVASSAGAPPPCELDDCLSRVRAVVDVSLAAADAPALVGQWTEGSGLTGGELYLFDDGTYMSTEWGCVQPETIQDMGRWTVDESVLQFEPAPEVTWALPRGGNRRYVTLEIGGAVRLLGLDWSVHALEDLAADLELSTPKEILDVLALSRAERWQGDGGELKKAELLKTAWRPEFYLEGAEAAER